MIYINELLQFLVVILLIARFGDDFRVPERDQRSKVGGIFVFCLAICFKMNLRVNHALSIQ